MPGGHSLFKQWGLKLCSVVGVDITSRSETCKELELENGKDGLLPLINVFSAICVNFIYGGRVGGIPPIRPQLIGVN